MFKYKRILLSKDAILFTFFSLKSEAHIVLNRQKELFPENIFVVIFD